MLLVATALAKALLISLVGCESMTRSSNLMALTATLTGFPHAAFAGICVLCRQALESGGNHGLIERFYRSILLIAGVPLMILTVVGIIVRRQHHGKRHANAHAASTMSTLR